MRKPRRQSTPNVFRIPPEPALPVSPREAPVRDIRSQDECEEGPHFLSKCLTERNSGLFTQVTRCVEVESPESIITTIIREATLGRYPLERSSYLAKPRWTDRASSCLRVGYGRVVKIDCRLGLVAIPELLPEAFRCKTVEAREKFSVHQAFQRRMQSWLRMSGHHPAPCGAPD